MSHAEVVSSSLTRGTVFEIHPFPITHPQRRDCRPQWQRLALAMHLRLQAARIACYKTAWARPGFEPGTSRTLSENHTPRPTSQLIQEIVSQFEGKLTTSNPLSEKNATLVGREGPAGLSLVAAACDRPMFGSSVFSQKSFGLVRDLNPGPLAPKARIIPLDQRATHVYGCELCENRSHCSH